MKIQIPKNLDLQSTLNFCNILDGLQEDNNYVYDYKDMSTLEPFGMLLLGSKIRNFVSSKDSSNHSESNFKNKGYAAHMGYFKSVNLDFGKDPGEAKGNDTYQPITKIDLKKIKEESIKDGTGIYQYIESTSKDLARVLTKQPALRQCLSFSIRELLRNVYEHSESEEIWYAAQYWPSRDLVEVAILDEGIGIKNSLEKSKKIDVGNDEEAMRLALEPGVSCTGIGKTGKDEYSNQGFGLYMISSICMSAGNFVMCSGNTCLEINSTETTLYETSFQGTAIRMRLQPSKSDELLGIMAKLSKDGSKKAKEYKNLDKVSVQTVAVV